MNLDALFKLTNGLYILGANDKGRYVGSLVDAVTQVAHDPAIVVVSCGNQSYTKSSIEKSNEFSLSVLCKSVDPFVLGNFGFQSSRDVNKWDNVNFYVIEGLPYLEHNIAAIRCKVLNKIEFVSNTMFIAEVIDADSTKDEDPLTYRDYRGYFKSEVLKSFENYKKLGAKPELSPVSQTPQPQSLKEENMTENNDNKKWVCTVCGYVYDGEIPFEELPDDWLCPLCGVDKSFFELREI